MYAHIINLLQRVLHWCLEGRIKHIVSSILRPDELRFKDLVDEIARCSRIVDQISFAASQVELRDMHIEQKELHMTVPDLKRVIAESSPQLPWLPRFQASNLRDPVLSDFVVYCHDILDFPRELFRFCQFLSHRSRQRAICELDPYWRPGNCRNGHFQAHPL